MPIAFVDIETTGTDPNRHHIWEIAIVRPDLATPSYCVQLAVDLRTADPGALRITNFYDRHSSERLLGDERTVAKTVAGLLSNTRLAGNVISFDAAFLDSWLRQKGQAPAWDYHLIDVEAIAVGYLMAELRDPDQTKEKYRSLEKQDRHKALVSLYDKWSSKTISELLGVPLPEQAHTALGDAKHALAMYEAVCGPFPRHRHV